MLNRTASKTWRVWLPCRYYAQFHFGWFRQTADDAHWFVEMSTIIGRRAEAYAKERVK